MINMIKLDAKLKKYFWNVDFDTLDAEKNAKYILERILDLGDEETVKWMKKTFSKKDILNALKNNRKISKKSLNFWNLVFKNR